MKRVNTNSYPNHLYLKQKVNLYVNLKLVQEIDADHDLELIWRRDVIEKISHELIGEKLRTIMMLNYDLHYILAY